MPTMQVRDLEFCTEYEDRYKLVVSERFLVEEIDTRSHSTFISVPYNGTSYPGGGAGGFKLFNFLRVRPLEEGVCVRRLSFDGLLVVMAGEIVDAKILRSQERKRDVKVWSDKSGYNQRTGRMERPFWYETVTEYFDRPFKPEEEALELKVISSDGKALRRYASAGYGEVFRSAPR